MCYSWAASCQLSPRRPCPPEGVREGDIPCQWCCSLTPIQTAASASRRRCGPRDTKSRWLRARPAPGLGPPRVPDPKAATKPGAAAAGPTLQGSLAVMDLTEVTQAVSIGRKTGRLVLSLKAGQGAILFDSGRVVHAEFAGKTGEGAFNALVVASHRERGGSFSFVPVAAGDASQLPSTIQTDLETLLLNIAVEMDESQRDTRN